MRKGKDVPKVPVTCRIQKNNLDRLKKHGAEIEQTVSFLMNKAVEEYLENGPSFEGKANNGVSLDSDDIKRIGPVLEVMGAPMSLELFLEIIKYQRMVAISKAAQ